MGADAAKVRRGRKYDQVIGGARDIFLREGFEGASVDDIARAAGVSKATLYNYFPDKRLLFMEVATGQCQAQAHAVLAQVDLTRPPREVLPVAAKAYMRFALSELGTAMFRIAVSEAARFPEVGEEFYRCGLGMVRTYLVDYLQGASERGEVRIDDFEIAAEQFAMLCKAGLWTRRLFGLDRDVPDAEVDRVIDEAVETFMARFGV